MSIKNVLETLEPSVNRALKELLPDEADLGLLEELLNRKLSQESSTRDYSLYAFHSAYSLALPFMRAGQKKILPGEALYLKALAKDVRLNLKTLEKIVLESQSEQKSTFSNLVELDYMARAFLNTSGLDRYEELFLDALEQLKEKGLLSEEDEGLLKKAFLNSEAHLGKKKHKVLNALPSYSLKNQTSVEGPFITMKKELMDERPMSFDFLTPLMKDFLISLKENSFKEDSLGFGAFLPLIRALNKENIISIFMEIEKGTLKSFTLIRKPENEDVPPVFGPFRSQLAALLHLTKGRRENLEALNLEQKINDLKEKQVFFVSTVLGGVSVPKNLDLFYEENDKSLLNRKENEVKVASEVYVIKADVKKAINLDPVSVPYITGNEDYPHLSMTRFLYFLSSPKRPFAHQGVPAILSNEIAFSPACMDRGGRLAKQILKDSFSLLTGENGEDRKANSYEESLLFLKNKYPRLLNGLEVEKDILKAITGQFGQTFGLSEEVYSLFYQNSFSKNPIFCLCGIEAPRFLSNVRTFPQRFYFKSFLP